MIKTHAFLPAKAHVSQNPVFMVVEVDLASWWEECMSQFSCDAVETMVQIGLQTVCVVGGVEACQDRERERETYLRTEKGNPHSVICALCRQQQGDDELQKTELFLQPSPRRMTTIPLTVTENLCRTLEFAPKGTDKA